MIVYVRVLPIRKFYLDVVGQIVTLLRAIAEYLSTKIASKITLVKIETTSQTSYPGSVGVSAKVPKGIGAVFFPAPKASVNCFNCSLLNIWLSLADLVG